MLGTGQHTLDGAERIGFEGRRLRLEVHLELDGNLVDVVVLALMLFPDVLQVGTGDEHQVVLARYLTTVADHAPAARSTLDEVQFIELVTVDGKSTLLFVPVGHVHKVVFAQRSNLM